MSQTLAQAVTVLRAFVAAGRPHRGAWLEHVERPRPAMAHGSAAERVAGNDLNCLMSGRVDVAWLDRYSRSTEFVPVQPRDIDTSAHQAVEVVAGHALCGRN